MNFEDTLKNFTASAREEEVQKELARKKANARSKYEFETIIKVKETIESTFLVVKKYYPNASFERTHSIENGEIVPHFGTFDCCFLDFDKNEQYKIPYQVTLGFNIVLEDDSDVIKIQSIAIENPQQYTNHFAEFLDNFKCNSIDNNFYYVGTFEENLIKESTQKVIQEFLSKFN